MTYFAFINSLIRRTLFRSRCTGYLISFAVLCGTAINVYSAQKSPSHPLRVAFVGDPQVNDSTEMSYARRSIYRELASRKDIALAIFLGDLVNDNMALIPESVRIIDSLPYPCLMIPGNHDRDVYRAGKGASQKDKGNAPFRTRDLSTWKETVGYVDTSFTVGRIRFILMNNVRARNGGMSDYEGGFTQRQKHWLDSLLNQCPNDAHLSSHTGTSNNQVLTILATHIPFSQMKGRDSVLALIPDLSRMLFVSGHTHSVARNCISDKSQSDESAVSAEEIIAGATCGSWWRGVKDENGIPYALQNCGAPRGYFVADISKTGRYTLDYKCVGQPNSDRLTVWMVEDSKSSLIGSDRTGSHADTFDDYAKHFRLEVNVYGGSPSGSATIRIPKKLAKRANLNGRTIDCSLSSDAAPEVQEIIDANASVSREYRKAHRDEFIPLRRKPSPHLWESDSITLRQDEDLQNIYVTVQYSDPSMKIRLRRVPVQFR